MQSQDSQVPTAPAKDAAPLVDSKTEPAPRKATARKAKKAPATPTIPPEVAPLTPAQRAAKLQDCTAKLRGEIEPVLRAFQAEIADFSTDAAYDFKQATDALLLDANEAMSHFAKMLVKPDYTPDAWRADVLAGKIEDVTLPVFTYEDEPAAPNKAKSERKAVAQDEEISVGEPIGPRTRN